MDDDLSRPAAASFPDAAPAAPVDLAETAQPGGLATRVTEPDQADQSPTPSELEQFESEPADWAWVEEWRRGGEPTPWGPGLALAGFTTFLVASAVYVLSSGLADHPIIDIAVNVLVAAGLGPALWLSRGLPVLRWIAGGAILGVLAAWFSVLVFMA